MTLILGIDPAKNATGLALVRLPERRVLSADVTRKIEGESAHVIDRLSEQAQSIALEVLAFCDGRMPDRIVAETPSGHSGFAAGRAAGMVIAIVSLVPILLDIDCPLRWIAPKEVKKAATGDPSASKTQVKLSMFPRFPGAEQSLAHIDGAIRHNAADAIAAVWADFEEMPRAWIDAEIARRAAA